MVTYFMCRQFFKSGEFNESKNKYARLEVMSRIPFFILLDFILIVKVIYLIK